MEKQNPIWKLLADVSKKKGINEIVINSPEKAFIEREGIFNQLKVEFKKAHAYDFIRDVAGYNHKPCNLENPIFDGVLPDGSRANFIIEPYAKNFPAITIRKFNREIKTFDDNPGVFGMGDDWIYFLKCLVKSRMTLAVSGGTGVGKTTFLNLLLQEIPHEERVITIEDTIELSFNTPNVVRLESKVVSSGVAAPISPRELVKNALRMRPDRIIMGEARGEEVFDLLQLLNTGHEGSMTSIHSNSPEECISRLENLFLLAGYKVPIPVVRKQIQSAFNFIIQLTRLKDGRRVIGRINEITGIEGSQILMSTIAKHDGEGLKSTGITPLRMNEIHSGSGLATDYFSKVNK